MIYDSADDGKMYQIKPVYSRPSLHPPKGWTDTTLGYINEAKQWSMCVIRNRKLMKRTYTWAVHINLNREYPPDDISPMWKKVARKLEDRGIVALWVREPNRLNKLHYHIIVKNEISRADLMRSIDDAMPPRSEVVWRKRIEPVINEWRLCYYVFKAKVKGYDKKGIFSTDLYRAKRLLFKPNMPFRKVGTIGDFWEQGKNKTRMWDEIKAIEKKIGDGLEKPNVKRLAKYVYDYLSGYVPLKKIERSFGYDADGPAVRDWIGSLLAGEWADEDAAVEGY
ncbi:MAG: hypothetical protein K2X38_10165 [Gemmataceae bacterium]|nr:hypothetical protein [Gemmataceae bacterium]